MILQSINHESIEELRKLFDPNFFREGRARAQRIADQHGISLEEFTGWGPEEMQIPTGRQMMLDLLQVLEEEVEHPPVWYFTRLHCLYLTDTPEPRRWLASVQVIIQNPAVEPSFYEVCYSLKPPWHHGAGYTTDTREAARLVVDGFQRGEGRAWTLGVID
jgi:hypothetical protein